MNKRSLRTILLAATASLLVSQPLTAQQPSTPNAVPGAGASKEALGPSADTIKPYKPAGRDPFRKEVKPKAGKGTPKNPRQVGHPTLEARRADYRQRVNDAATKGMAEPNPVSQYLVSEVEITGVYRDDHGAGAFVKAQPTGTMFFVRRGDRLYNGEVVRIETDDTDATGAKVLFREKSFFEVNGKQTEQERVVAKVPGAITAGATRK